MSSSFQELQYAFAANIRDPGREPMPAGVEPRRMHIYQELFYNNIEGFISGGFPVLRSLIADDVWCQLVRDFMRHHRAKTPYFLEIAEEFLDYLNSAKSLPVSFPFLLELAHYEWVELAIQVADEKQVAGKNGDWLKQKPLMSQLAWPLAYQFDVHRIGSQYCPQTPPEQPTFLVVYRNENELKVEFMELNPVTFRLLELIEEYPEDTGEALLQRVVAELNHPNPKVVMDGGLRLFNDLHEKGVLLGVA